MPRWEAGAQDRLLNAAMELFTAEGYDQTSVADIAAAAGVTERTFFRHFADKREVLFGGANLLEEPMLAALADGPDPAANPGCAMLSALTAAGEALESRRDFTRRRHAVVASHASLRERELLKLAGLADSAADALRQRGVSEEEAVTVAEVAVTLFRVAFERWVSDAGAGSFAEVLAVAAGHLGRWR